MRKKTVILTVVGVTVLVVLAGAGTSVYFAARNGGAAKTVTEEYFRALEDQRLDDAYGALCADARSRTARADFESAVAARPPVSHTMTDELRVNELPWKTTAKVGVSVTYADGAGRDLLVPLVREDGDWLICDPSV